jgi:hypothetical protein
MMFTFHSWCVDGEQKTSVNVRPISQQYFSCLWYFFNQKKFIFFCGFGLGVNVKLMRMDEEKGLGYSVAKQKCDS